MSIKGLILTIDNKLKTDILVFKEIYQFVLCETFSITLYGKPMAEKTQKSLADDAYSKLVELLISGKLEAGMKVSEKKLSAELGIGRTPIREAIRRLCEDGLFYQKPQSGTYIAVPDRQSLIDAYEVRLALESFAAQQAATRIGSDQLAILKIALSQTKSVYDRLKESGLESLDEKLTRDFLAADVLFHSTILQAAGNMLLLKSVTAGQIRNRVFGLASHKRTLGHINRVLKIHKAVIKALSNGDSSSAAESMEIHIRQSMAEALDAFDSAAAGNSPVYDGLCKTAVVLQTIMEK